MLALLGESGVRLLELRASQNKARATCRDACRVSLGSGRILSNLPKGGRIQAKRPNRVACARRLPLEVGLCPHCRLVPETPPRRWWHCPAWELPCAALRPHPRTTDAAPPCCWQCGLVPAERADLAALAPGRIRSWPGSWRLVLRRHGLRCRLAATAARNAHSHLMSPRSARPRVATRHPKAMQPGHRVHVVCFAESGLHHVWLLLRQVEGRGPEQSGLGRGSVRLWGSRLAGCYGGCGAVAERPELVVQGFRQPQGARHKRGGPRGSSLNIGELLPNVPQDESC